MTRILVLGDSHVASDYITGMLRHRLQDRFGDAGRGLIQPDQPSRFGGRRLRRSGGWGRERIVDAGQAGKTFGLTGLALESRKGAWIDYVLADDDRWVELHFEAAPRGPEVEVRTGTTTRRFSTRAEARRLAVWRFPVRGPGRLRLRASGPGFRLFGVAFETGEPGVVVDVMGPVGAESQVYLQMDRRSFVDHLRIRGPDLVISMVGGNDAHKIRKGWWTFERVERQYRALIGVLRDSVPNAECLAVTPMDAGARRGGRIVGKPHIAEVRSLIRRVGLDHGCAGWDLFEAMGGAGSVGRWVDAGVMNPEDLLHPRRAAADVLGRGFAQSLIAALQVAGAGQPSRDRDR